MWHVWQTGEVYTEFWLGGPDGKGPHGRARRRWEDKTNMSMQEVGRGGMEWIKLAQDRVRRRALANAVMNLRVP